MAEADPSGSYDYRPTLAEIALEVFDRLGIRAAEITQDHFVSMRRSMNLMFSSWSNRGVNLWLIEKVTVNLSQGVSEYAIPESTVNVEEALIRWYQMVGATDVTPAFTTVSGQTTITATQASHGYAAGGFVDIQVPVSIGGLILLGFYQVVSVPDANTFTFAAASAATASESGGAVPQLATVANSTTVTVTLPDHGYLGGESFVVQVATSVGGITLLGSYTVITVTDADTFTFAAVQNAGAIDSAFENDGDTLIAGQQTATGPQDRIMWPFSRVDYTNLPNKSQQAFPTNYYYDRLISPTVTLWPVPDGNGPYQLVYNRVTQPQDANPQGSQTAFIPYRAQEAFHADLTGHMAIKWRPDIAEKLIAYAGEKWTEFASTDSEKVTLHVVPMLEQYYRA